MSSITIKRLQNELSTIEKRPLKDMTVELVDSRDLFHWKAAIKGPLNSPYANGYFLLDIQIPQEYPFAPPKKISQSDIHAGIRYAIKCDNMEMLTTLIDYVVDPDLDSGYPMPILHLPVYYGNIEMLQFLLDAGLNANVRDKEGADPEIERQGPMTALSLAASNEQFSIASYLAEGD
ncbi:unnamed protein product [Hymenolepis diminuta]|uniref:UBC core domain-containing protein n=1 Tax=Hymenolepis diminuta TaxID=6216 RepID=A0A0R3SGF8_HYMDI|nr:unnamed protein product [Hymenolepis diminuta]